MRRLPIFFLLDVSESMVGDDLRSLERGVEEIVQSLRQDPHALETVHVSVLAFAGVAAPITPLVDLVSFYPPRLPVGSGTSLGAGLNCLMDEIDSQVKRRSETQRGDYKPVVYLMTDGHPTDDCQAAITRWNNNYGKRATLIAIAIGKSADTKPLQDLTEHIIVFDHRKPGDLDSMIRWVTASISIQSQRIDSGAGVSLAKPAGDLSFLDAAISRSQISDKNVIIPGLCQHSKRPYLIKYMPIEQAFSDIPPSMRDMGMLAAKGCYPVDDTYEKWSDPSLASPVVNSNQLLGGAPCPHCQSPFSLALCSCGKVHCLSHDGEATCPHCGSHGVYSDMGEDVGSLIERGRG